MFRLSRCRFAILCLAASAIACSSETGKPDSTTARRDTTTDSAGGLVISRTTNYVEATGTSPAELLVAVSGDSTGGTSSATACDGTPAKVVAPRTILWVEGIQQGKPLPADRRYQLVSDGCALSPVVQGVVVGAAINVFNDDRMKHTLVFIRSGTTDTVQRMPFTNAAQLVATDKLARSPGVIEVRCLQHANERAYIAVFDHPYFGVVAQGGTLRLDGVPPGSYRVMSWREGMTSPVPAETTIGATGRTTLTIP